MLGARNTCEIVPRSNKSSIGRHSIAILLLVVLPAIEYLE